MPCRSPGPHPGGRLRGLAGASPGPYPGGKLRGLVGEVSRPTPSWEVEGSGWGVCPGGVYKGDPPYGNVWVVCILLESILVVFRLIKIIMAGQIFIFLVNFSKIWADFFSG